MGHGSGVIGLGAGLGSIPFSGSNELLSEAFQLVSVDGCVAVSETIEDEDDW
jgi:hypothetical protein